MLEIKSLYSLYLSPEIGYIPRSVIGWFQVAKKARESNSTGFGT